MVICSTGFHFSNMRICVCPLPLEEAGPLLVTSTNAINTFFDKIKVEAGL